MQSIASQGLCQFTRFSYSTAYAIDMVLGCYFASVISKYASIIDAPAPSYLIAFPGSFTTLSFLSFGRANNCNRLRRRELCARRGDRHVKKEGRRRYVFANTPIAISNIERCQQLRSNIRESAALIDPAWQQYTTCMVKLSRSFRLSTDTSPKARMSTLLDKEKRSCR